MRPKNPHAEVSKGACGHAPSGRQMLWRQLRRQAMLVLSHATPSMFLSSMKRSAVKCAPHAFVPPCPAPPAAGTGATATAALPDRPTAPNIPGSTETSCHQNLRWASRLNLEKAPRSPRVSAKSLLVIIPKLICWAEFRCVSANRQCWIRAGVGHASQGGKPPVVQFAERDFEVPDELRLSQHPNHFNSYARLRPIPKANGGARYLRPKSQRSASR